jgi:hypothetical protein
MPTVVIDSIATRYEVVGSGPPLLMYAPCGFNAVVEAWSTLGGYQKIKLLDHLPAHFTCILFDRRECGQSGGRIEPITWTLRGARQRPARPLAHLARASHRRLHGLCAGRCLCRCPSGHGGEHDPVLASRRCQIPHVKSSALHGAYRLRS